MLWNLLVGAALLCAVWPSAPLAGALARQQPPGRAGAWERLPDFPVAAQELGATAVDGVIYTVGGQVATPAGAALVSGVFAFDPAEGVWQRRASLPGVPRDHVALAAVGSRLFAIGGLTAGPGPSVPDVYEYLPALNRWLRRADLPNPRPELAVNYGRGAMGVAVLDGEIYVAGGLSGPGTLRDPSDPGSADLATVAGLAKYDPATNRWTELAALATPRAELALVALEGRLHALGGADAGLLLDAHDIYDPADDQWGAGAPLLQPRSGAGAATLPGRIVLFGGVGSLAAGGVRAETDVYDAGRGAWRAAAAMGVGRHSPGVAVVDGAIYAIAGGTWPGDFGESAAVERFTLGARCPGCRGALEDPTEP